VTVVVGTAGHIDHGKTTLLRALTGIDADRLPEERRRGMTIDVGYAHLTLPDGTELDFVDVPGHDRLVGNMLVGAGEIDAALLVVAADDGLRAQTHEHIDLLDALAVRHALVAITKADLVPEARTGEVCEAVAARLAPTALAGAPIVVVSGATGDGIADLRAGLVTLRDRVMADFGWVALSARPVRLAVDRAFRIKGRGTVVTGTLRGGPLARGANLRIVPGDATVRVRGVQVHGTPVDEVAGGGRTALNLAGEPASGLHRGVVLTNDPELHATDRLLVMLAASVPDRSRFRVHLGTAAAEAVVGRSGRDALDFLGGNAAAVLRLDASLAAATGDRFVLRRAATSGPAVVGGVILDPLPARGVSRRRQTAERVAALAAAAQAADPAAIRAARIDLHGIVASERLVAPDVHVAASAAALEAVRAYHATRPGDAGPALAAVRSAAARALRRHATVTGPDAAARAAVLVDELVSDGHLVRDGDRVRAPDHQPAAVDPEVSAAMDRLVEALAVLAPPSLRDAAAAAGCPPAAIRELERIGRIVVLDEDLAYAMPTYRDLAAKALALAARGPLAPAAFRDATGTSRRYVMPILEDLDRRGILQRTPAGHVPGPRATAGVRGGT
jgi:selenocysteine-specific elongation factor